MLPYLSGGEWVSGGVGMVREGPEKPEWSCELRDEALGHDVCRRIKSYFRVFQYECKMIKVVERKDYFE